jgi:hypothetical protein
MKNRIKCLGKKAAEESTNTIVVKNGQKKMTMFKQWCWYFQLCGMYSKKQLKSLKKLFRSQEMGLCLPRHLEPVWPEIFRETFSRRSTHLEPYLIMFCLEFSFSQYLRFDQNGVKIWSLFQLSKDFTYPMALRRREY